ncbi:MAG: hypothetical protein E6441_05095 [Clostridium sp.]|uniref:hypothetical protein n=1 Tax=Clostridium sp. TaxID=1506 RepID=UPI00290AA0A2|nr:hypothetical protein [Clostridium sp.]MDU5209798.1 hypothetical protein [Clostridium sp.]MDU6760830.1 hypothetical protein [Clostridium sp.]
MKCIRERSYMGHNYYRGWSKSSSKSERECKRSRRSFSKSRSRSFSKSRSRSFSKSFSRSFRKSNCRSRWSCKRPRRRSY